jgi:CheY-like chemotaxis protein
MDSPVPVFLFLYRFNNHSRRNMQPLILLVEDDAEDHFIFCDALETISSAAEVQVQPNGIEALKFLHSNPAGKLPSIIITDLNMPKMNGCELLVQLKSTAAFSNIPVVIYTTSVNEKESAHCLKLGAAAYISKPLTLRESIEVAELILRISSELQEK